MAVRHQGFMCVLTSLGGDLNPGAGLTKGLVGVSSSEIRYVQR